MPEKKGIITSRYWGPGKDPKVDPPDSVEQNAGICVNVMNPMAAKVAQDVITKGGTFEDAKKAAMAFIQKEKKERAFGPGTTIGQAETKKPEVQTESPNSDGPSEDEINRAKLYMRYIQTVLRLNGVNPKGLELWEMLDLINTGMEPPISFQNWLENVAEMEKGMMQNG